MKRLPEQLQQACVKHGEIYPQNQPILDRLLVESVEMNRVWGELEQKFVTGEQWGYFIAIIIDAANSYFEEQNTRNDRNEANRLAKQIAKKAGELAGLLEQFETLQERNSDDDAFGFLSLRVFKVIEGAADNDGYCTYNSTLKPKIDAVLHGYINSRYYPSLTDIFKYLEKIFKKHKAKAPRNISPRLFCEELVEEIKIGSRSNYLPYDFNRISDKTMAAITKAALALGQDFTEENVKSYRLWDVK